jgi:hypothetical protein
MIVFSAFPDFPTNGEVRLFFSFAFQADPIWSDGRQSLLVQFMRGSVTNELQLLL